MSIRLVKAHGIDESFPEQPWKSSTSGSGHGLGESQAGIHLISFEQEAPEGPVNIVCVPRSSFPRMEVVFIRTVVERTGHPDWRPIRRVHLSGGLSIASVHKAAGHCDAREVPV